MSNSKLRNITNNFQDVRLVSLSTWRRANEIIPRDRGGPYVVMEEGYDPQDLTMKPNEFIIGRSGKWLSLGLFFRMPITERRAEFVFGTAAEVMRMMHDLPSKVSVVRPDPKARSEPEATEKDEMADAFEAGKSRSSGG